VRRLYFIIGLLVCGLLTGIARADAFKLVTGETLNGEALTASANEQGMQIKLGEGQYQRVPWANFSQEDLKNFARNQKLEQFVEPFIEITQEEKIKKTEVNIKQPPRLERAPDKSLFGAFFSSGLGLFIVMLLYAANVYAGYEVAIFRAQPPLMVCGLSAIPGLGLLAPIVFLSMPTRLKRAEEAVDEAPAEPEPQAAAAPVEQAVNPMLAETAPHPAGLKLAHTETAQTKPALPQTVTYQRGQFTFNRRFFETKFPGFFGVVKREADRDMVLVIKTIRGEYTGERISRIAASDLHLQVNVKVQHGQASEEVLIPFQEIQEIRLKHKDT
jgi:hypothetical protein